MSTHNANAAPLTPAIAERLSATLRADGLPLLVVIAWPSPTCNVAVGVLPPATTTLLLAFSAGDSLAALGLPLRGHDPVDAWAEQALHRAATAVQPHVTAVLGMRNRAFATLPLQRLALASGALWQGHHGLLLHPRYGSWLALRGALALRSPWPLASVPLGASPCDTCPDLCRRACPAHTYAHTDWNAAACAAARLAGPPCNARCAARDACPIGTAQRYLPQWRSYHAGVSLRTLQTWQADT